MLHGNVSYTLVNGHFKFDSIIKGSYDVKQDKNILQHLINYCVHAGVGYV